MQIKNMFEKDIHREINGVIKVDQNRSEAIEQELSEYIITRELQKHFDQFFKNYLESFHRPTANIGVWISGFFGSGKSHFLKILSYLLENREVNDIKTVERFKEKLEDHPSIYSSIEESTKGETDTILFNIDIEGPTPKTNTAVIQVFAKMFYNHLGFYGENLKVAKLEQYIERQGKTKDFKAAFEENYGEAWVDSRDIFDFVQDEVVAALKEVLGMSEETARSYFESTEETNLSIASLVSEIKAYVDSRSEGYRLLFMIDEVGQYVGEDREMLLNLQSIIEKIGSECLGKVWVICTGQEALDEIIKTRQDEFSRIQARFTTRLSLSSSSADEVIQKRILKKTESSEEFLIDQYEEQKNVMSNLFKFKEAVGDIRGYESAEEYAMNFPFVPYQFILMQKVFPEIRKHGNAGKHLSGGERSMLSGFQETAQRVADRDEYTIVPFWMFYDTVHTFLDSSIRRVVERAEKAALEDKGLQKTDVDTLKLLYMIRYVDDIPANMENILIMMAEDIRTDKLLKRTEIAQALDRLLKENYIAKAGDVFNFLTDEEQDIEREIQNEIVDQSEVVSVISEMIFEKIYTNKKLRYDKKYDFDFDKKVDGVNYGNPVDGLKLEILTVATSSIDKNDMTLQANSYGQATIVLGDKDYYSLIEEALKIEKYARKKNIQQLAQSMQNIIRNKQEYAEEIKTDAIGELKAAFKEPVIYIDGQKMEVKGSNPQEKIEGSLNHLVFSTYKKLDYITKNIESDDEIEDILNYDPKTASQIEINDNAKAIQEVKLYIDAQDKMNQPTNMADIQKRYSAKPYGWRDLDIASVVAKLINEQNIVAKYGGVVIKQDDPKLPQMLYKKSETGKTKIEKRENISDSTKTKILHFLRDYLGKMNIPQDDDGLVDYIVEAFKALENQYRLLLAKYTNKHYPNKDQLEGALGRLQTLLKARFDNIAFINRIIESSGALEEDKEQVEDIEFFFNHQVAIFDKALNLLNQTRKDSDYYANNDAVEDALNHMRLIVIIGPRENTFNYGDIRTLHDHMDIVTKERDRLLEVKREKAKEAIRQSMEAIHQEDRTIPAIAEVIKSADDYYGDKKKEIDDENSLVVIEGYIQGIWNRRDHALKKIESIKENMKPKEPKITGTGKEEKPKKIRKLRREEIFAPKTLKSKEDIRDYLLETEGKLIAILKDWDGIEI